VTAPGTPAALPELGPLLGRLIAPPGEKTPFEAALDGVRVALLTELFDKAGAARGFLLVGDLPGARAALGRTAWLEVWERAVAAALECILEEIERNLRDAAAVSRYPRERLAAALPDPEERRLLAGRLSAAGIGLETALERLGETGRDWNEQLRRVCGELEAAWDRLVSTALQELAGWNRRALEIRVWRRPWMPLLVAGGVLLALSVWLGLVLGGYLPTPGWLRPLAEWVWGL
jgi:hypothetical protein